MQYRFAKEHLDYSDLSSGRVFYSQPGRPAFPVRLANEIFQRCIMIRSAHFQDSAPCTLYDPCCGAAYQLSILAYLHRGLIRKVIGSDIDGEAVALARRNLGLLSIDGLDIRINEISTMIEQYHKDSHKQALKSACAMREKIFALAQTYPLEAKVFQASAVDSREIIKNIGLKSVDIVFTDIPYGQHTHWKISRTDKQRSPLWSMLEALTAVLSPSGIVAVVADKGQTVSHDDYQRIEHFQVGKRRVVIQKLMPGFRTLRIE